MSDYTEATNYMLLAADTHDSWMKDRALRRGAEEIAQLQSEVERLRAQVEDLEDECRNAQKYMVWLSGGKEVPTVKAWLLRKQAEAVEHCLNRLRLATTAEGCKNHIQSEAHRLRQQAAESENGTVTRKAD